MSSPTRTQVRRVRPGAEGPDGREVRARDGRALCVPEGWERVPLGHPALSRCLDPVAPRWIVEVREGSRVRRLGGWVGPERLRAVASLEACPDARGQALGTALELSLVRHLDFLPRHRPVARELARCVAGSVAGSLAGSPGGLPADVPVDADPARLEEAVLDWMRAHVPGVEEGRLTLRRPDRAEELARARAATLLATYRGGGQIDPGTCPLRRALAAQSAGE